MKRQVMVLGALLWGAFAATVLASPETSNDPVPARTGAVAPPLAAGPQQGFVRTEPDADTFLAVGLDEPQGHQSMLLIGELNGGDYETLIHFPLPIDEIGVGGTIDKAELALSKRECVMADPGALAVEIRVVTKDWKENEVTWDRKPNSAGPIIKFEVPETDKRGYFRVDVTEIVRKWYLGENENLGFQLQPDFDQMSRRCVFWARETGPFPLNQPPLLEINHSGGVTPTFTPTSSPTASNTPTPSITPTASETPTPSDTPDITDTPTATSTRMPQPVFLPINYNRDEPTGTATATPLLR